MNKNVIINFLEKLFPLDTMFNEDKCGIQIKSDKTDFKNIIISLDITNNLVEKAIKNKVDMIIVHHPFLWYNTWEEELVYAPYKKQLISKIVKHNICVYVLHSNYNENLIGMPSNMVERLKWQPMKLSSNISSYISVFNPNSKNSLKEFIKKIKLTFDVEYVQCFNPKNVKKVTRFAILPGKGSLEYIFLANKFNPNFIVTCDVKWSEWITLQEMNIPIINICHNMENIFSSHIKKLLMKEFKELNILTHKTTSKYKVL